MSSSESYFVKDNMVYRGATTDKAGCSCSSLIFFGIVIFILLSLILAAFLLLSDYNSWEEGFLLERDSENVVFVEDILISEINQIEGIITEFSESKETVDFIELTPYEFAIVISEPIALSLPDGVMLDQVYVEPYEQKWTVYLKTSNESASLPWVAFEIRKDNVESAELDVSAVRVGDFDLDTVGFGYVAENINNGYRDALMFVNDNGFTGRRLDNIELGSDVIVIKGTIREEVDTSGDLQIPVRGF